MTEYSRELIDLTWDSSATPQTAVIDRLSCSFQRLIDQICTRQRVVDDLVKYPTGEVLTDVFWRSASLDDKCTLGLESSGERKTFCLMLRQCVDLCHKLIPLAQAESPAKDQELFNLRQQAQEISQTESEVFRFTRTIETTDRSFSSTKKGYVGWMPKGASKGDELWIFNGCRVPFVLRPAEGRQGDERAYRVIGDCYIHGLMRSEASARVSGETQQIKLV